jgi:hypothetical protein
MKRIKYEFLSTEINHGTEENPDIERVFISKDFPYSEVALEAAKEEAYSGYEIYDDGQPDPAIMPTQLDRVEAQVTYTAMMTDTLLEV